MTLYANLHICSLILLSCHVKGDTSNELHPYVSIYSIMYFTCIFLMWLNGGKESWKYYHIYLLWQHSGCCGFGGHVFSVYALYLSLINALLLSAVIHTIEQRWGLTQRASGFLLWFQGPKGLGSASSGLCRAGAGRCSKKNTHRNQWLSICVPSTPAQLFWKPSPCFHRALWNKRKFKVVFFSRTIVALIFPRWKLAIQMQSSHGGQSGVSLTSFYVAHPSHQSLP